MHALSLLILEITLDVRATVTRTKGTAPPMIFSEMFIYLDFFNEANNRLAFYPQVMIVTSAIFEVQGGNTKKLFFVLK
jgi:hypothetical protein